MKNLLFYLFIVINIFFISIETNAAEYELTAEQIDVYSFPLDNAPIIDKLNKGYVIKTPSDGLMAGWMAFTTQKGKLGHVKSKYFKITREDNYKADFLQLLPNQKHVYFKDIFFDKSQKNIGISENGRFAVTLVDAKIRIFDLQIKRVVREITAGSFSLTNDYLVYRPLEGGALRSRDFRLEVIELRSTDKIQTLNPNQFGFNAFRSTLNIPNSNTIMIEGTKSDSNISEFIFFDLDISELIAKPIKVESGSFVGLLDSRYAIINSLWAGKLHYVDLQKKRLINSFSVPKYKHDSFRTTKTTFYPKDQIVIMEVEETWDEQSLRLTAFGLKEKKILWEKYIIDENNLVGSYKDKDFYFVSEKFGSKIHSVIDIRSGNNSNFDKSSENTENSKEKIKSVYSNGKSVKLIIKASNISRYSNDIGPMKIEVKNTIDGKIKQLNIPKSDKVEFKSVLNDGKTFQISIVNDKQKAFFNWDLSKPEPLITNETDALIFRKKIDKSISILRGKTEYIPSDDKARESISKIFPRDELSNSYIRSGFAAIKFISNKNKKSDADYFYATSKKSHWIVKLNSKYEIIGNPIKLDEIPNFGHATSVVSFDDKIALLNSRGVVVLNSSYKLVSNFEIGEGFSIFNSSLDPEMGNEILIIPRNDNQYKVYSLSSGKEVATLFITSNGDAVALLPSGFFSANNVNAAKNIIVRNRETGRSIPLTAVFDSLHRPDLVKQALLGDPHGIVSKAKLNLSLKKILVTGLSSDIKDMRLIQLKNNSALAKAEVKLNDGGMGKIIWRVNGTVVGIDESYVQKPSKSNKKKLIIERKLPLIDGKNTISIQTTNHNSTIYSKIFEKEILNKSENTLIKPKLFILSVGVNTYFEEKLRLKHSVSDATAIINILKEKNTQYSEVVTKLLTDDKVTKANIQSEITKIADKIRPEDTFIFYLAGHGVTHDGRFFFLPADINTQGGPDVFLPKFGVSQNDWRKMFSNIPSLKSLILYDSCESGSIVRMGKGDELEQSVSISKLASSVGRAVITASAENQFALEGIKGHGAFTYTILDAFKYGDQNDNNLLELSELSEYVKDKLPSLTEKKWGYTQEPQIKTSGQDFSIGSIITKKYEKTVNNKKGISDFRIGEKFYKGIGVRKDYTKAFEFYSKSANQDYEPAQNKLAKMYSLGEGVAKDMELSFAWYKKSANKGNSTAQFLLGLFYTNGSGVKKDDKKAFEWYKKSAEQGDHFAQAFLADFYYFGDKGGIKQDYKKAIYWHEKAAKKGHKVSNKTLGIMHENGFGTDVNLKKAFYYYKFSSNEGDVYSMTKIGNMLFSGEGVPKNLTLGMHWLKEAAITGDVEAIAILQLNLEKEGYLEGYNLGAYDNKTKKAIALFDKEIKLRSLDTHISNSQTDKKDSKQIILETELEFHLNQAELGSIESQYMLGVMYHTGQGVKKDLEKAFDFYKGPAAKWHVKSIVAFGKMFANGEGTPKNKELALYWLEKAADLGDEEAIRLRDKLINSGELDESEKDIAFLIKQQRDRLGLDKIIIQPDMININGGKFKMGSHENEIGRLSNERLHSVEVNSFMMSKTEVTFIQWKECVTKGGCQSNKNPDDAGWGRGTRPVINVSWNDANEYTKWLSDVTGKSYRLPTEAEWEYAARAGTNTNYHLGNKISASQANFDGKYATGLSRRGKNLGKTNIVAQYPKNLWGLNDLNGNVSEWTCSDFDQNYNGLETKCSSSEYGRRVIRGGSWKDGAKMLRTASRDFSSIRMRSDNIGFRVVSSQLQITKGSN